MFHSASEPDRYAAGVFLRLERLLAQTGRGAGAGAVHHLRTHIRRVEALLQAGRAEEEEAKLLRQLHKLRRRAGRVRDLDVQQGLLLGLVVEGAEAARAGLLQRLKQERARRGAGLQARLDADTRRRLRRRLRRAQARLGETAETAAGWRRRVRAGVAELAGRYPVLHGRNLHAYRLECKRLRYWAEAGGPGLARQAAQLKRVQDAIGAWHDWCELAEGAQKAEAGASPALRAGLRSMAARQGVEALRVALAERENWAAGAAKRPPGREVARAGDGAALA